MAESSPSRNGEPLDKAEILKMADEITRVVDGGHHKAYGTNPYQTTMTAGNAWWRTVADAMRAYAQSEKVQTDPGTEKLLRDLLDRGYKMHVMAGTVRVAEHNPDHNDPLIAWMSDVRSVLYGNTKPTPEAPLG